ncbi:helix-turn-helix transcriptional regulator [Chitinilyticum litopenaei]|uniref:helix-turn-helix transcriptional regulator n=1 Tax=Chitinilyticum litopenaei TaxID=1121276 RepID=UPI00040D0095|nr:AlpA family phage regulatory protein [Chitinilyticum litopenaei]
MTQASQFPTLPQLLRRPIVEQVTGLSRSSIYAMMATGQFPQPVRIGARAVAWRSDEIADFVDSRARRAA